VTWGSLPLTGTCCTAALFGLRKAQGAAVEIGLDDGEEFGIDGDAVFFSAFAFAFDVDDGAAVVGGADVTDIRTAQFVSAQPGQQRGEDDGEIMLGSIGLAFRVTVLGDGRQQRLDRGAGEGLGQIVGQFGSADQLHRVGAELFAGVEEGAQHIPARPAALGSRPLHDRARSSRTPPASTPSLCQPRPCGQDRRTVARPATARKSWR
jgi:hypothetical protein